MNRPSQRGFTILELMIVVGIIAILATVVVPSWFRESRRGKARSEVSAMFAELSTKEEQYFLDQSQYLAIAQCPEAPNHSGPDVNVACNTGSYWAQIRVVPPQTMMTCTYEIDVGPSTVPPAPPAPFVLTSNPSTSWYYILATCDTDNDPTINSTYLTSNLDQSLQKANEGN